MESKPQQVIPVSDKYRTDLLLAFMRQRAADAERNAANLQVERLIERLDKDGQLGVAIREAGVLNARAHDAHVKLFAILSEVQKEVGPIDGLRIDPETGNLIGTPSKAPAATPGPVINTKTHVPVRPALPSPEMLHIS